MNKGDWICSGIRCKDCGHIKDYKEHVLKVIRDENYCDHQICQNCDYTEEKREHELESVFLDEEHCQIKCKNCPF